MHDITASDFWRRALAGERPPIPMNAPQPGYYRRTLVNGGPWVPARIWYGLPPDPVTGELLDRSPRAQCEVGGESRDALDQWTWLASRPIPKETFDWMMADRSWAMEWAPYEPAANPRKPINIRDLPIPF